MTALCLISIPLAQARALDKFKLANGGFGLWSNEGARIGQQAGIFKKHGLDVDVYGTAGAGESLQAVISGSVDASIGVGTSAVLGAFSKGAPVRIFGSNFLGSGDIFYYVRADSTINRFSDTTDKDTIAYSSAGSSSNMATLSLIQEAGVKAKPVATGDHAATLTQVLSGQITIGHGVPPFGLKEMAEGKIRILGTGNDAPSLRSQSTRVDIVGLKVMTERREVFLRFVKAYREVLDWMKSDPEAIRLWSTNTGIQEDLSRRAAYDFHPRSSADHLKVGGIEALIAGAIRQKFLDQQLSTSQLADLIQIPPN